MNKEVEIFVNSLDLDLKLVFSLNFVGYCGVRQLIRFEIHLHFVYV